MPNKSCNTRTITAIAIAVLNVVFTILIKAVNTNQDTTKAAIKIITSTGMGFASENWISKKH